MKNKLIHYIAAIFKDRYGNPSSKRVTGFIALALFVVFTIKSLTGCEINLNVFYTLAALAACQNALTLAEKPKNKGGYNDEF